MDTWLERLTLFAAWALLLWLLLERFVPAHPVEQCPALLPLAGAMACVATAPRVSAPWLRRLLLAAAIALIIVAFVTR